MGRTYMKKYRVKNIIKCSIIFMIIFTAMFTLFKFEICYNINSEIHLLSEDVIFVNILFLSNILTIIGLIVAICFMLKKINFLEDIVVKTYNKVIIDNSDFANELEFIRMYVEKDFGE